LVIDYSVPVYQITDQIDTDKYKQKESEIREKIANQLRFEPEIKITKEDISIYDKKIILGVHLKPQTRYTLKSGQVLSNVK
jgi:hypothetical protein